MRTLTWILLLAAVAVSAWFFKGCRDTRTTNRAWAYADSVRADTLRFIVTQRAYEDSIRPILDTAVKTIRVAARTRARLQQRTDSLDKIQTRLDSVVAAIGDTSNPIPRSLYDQQKFIAVGLRITIDTLARANDDLQETVTSLLSSDSLRQRQLRYSYARIASLEMVLDTLSLARECVINLGVIGKWCPSPTVAFFVGAAAATTAVVLVPHL